MSDITLICCDCNAEFTFTERDQEFFKTNNFSNPKRCKPCRAAKKAQRGNNNRGQR